MNYTHLTQDERYQIAILSKAGHDRSGIAQLMDRHKSTIGREMRRNRGERGYRPKQAHAFYQARLLACENSPRIAAETWAMVDTKLAETWSPEQISGYFKVNRQPAVSHEAIYQRIYADKRAGGTLHLALRCQKAVTDGGQFPTRSRLTNVLPSSATARASVTGKRIWSSAPDRSRHSSRSTSAFLATL